jgi:hypothetical protein
MQDHCVINKVMLNVSCEDFVEYIYINIDIYGLYFTDKSLLRLWLHET